MYSKAAEEDDNKMAESWRQNADGILIFTGLFSAAVAALLSVTVQDLRPNSQDTSAFYLGNIYGILADPNVTLSSTPSPVAKPPPFSPPRYSIWVNSLWFLSFVLSLFCALFSMSMQQWARRYIMVTQPARCSPEKRARMRALFTRGMDKSVVSWVAELLPVMLHLSLFLFFAGLGVFLFNINHAVFGAVVWLFVWFSMWYGVVILATIRDSLFLPLFDPVLLMKFKVEELLSERSGTVLRGHSRLLQLEAGKTLRGKIPQGPSQQVLEHSCMVMPWHPFILVRPMLYPL